MSLEQNYAGYIEEVWLGIRIHAWVEWEFLLERRFGVRWRGCEGQAAEFGNEKPVETFNQESDMIIECSRGSCWGQDTLG